MTGVIAGKLVLMKTGVLKLAPKFVLVATVACATVDPFGFCDHTT
jgi:uncharacterized YccA/Bax inhibitor family protein